MVYGTEDTLNCIKDIRDGVPFPFVLVGGGAVNLLGSLRTTDDVDILVPSDMNVEDAFSSLQTVNGFSKINGKLCYESNDRKSVVKIDILRTVDKEATFEDMDPNTTMLNGVRILKLDFALAVKVNCFYLRADDENGENKKRSDCNDMVFISRKMIQLNQQISDACAAMFRIGYYHMIVVRMNMDDADFQDLITVGIRKLLIPWEENTPEQREYYLYFASEGTDPLTTSLDDN